MSSRLDFVQRANAPYIEEQYARYLRDPHSVAEEWALFFAGFELAGRPGAATPSETAAPQTPGSGLFGVIQNYRVFGHLAARLDPLSEAPALPEFLEAGSMGFAESDLDAPVDPGAFWNGGGAATLRELMAALRQTYCGSLGVEYMWIVDEERRSWLQQRMEPGRNRPTLKTAERANILRQLLSADAFEEFLQVRYVGQKRFSLEGAGTLIPMLDVMIEEAGAMGVEVIVIGMSHRGRLNVLANIMGKPLESMFSEFEASFAPEDGYGHGDVKYHLGFSCRHRTRGGHPVHLDLRFNPSHLEFVNPVVMGSLHARQDLAGDRARERGIPVLIHGDAAFAGGGDRARDPGDGPAARLCDRRHHPHHRQQPDRLHHFARRRAPEPLSDRHRQGGGRTGPARQR